jgi:hypothetical protein
MLPLPRSLWACRRVPFFFRTLTKKKEGFDSDPPGASPNDVGHNKGDLSVCEVPENTPIQLQLPEISAIFQLSIARSFVV